MVGGSLSITVTVWVHDDALLLWSVTVQVMLVTPRLKTAGALLVIDLTPQLSAVTGVPKTTPEAEHPSLVKAVTGAGQEMVGGTLSLTVTVWVQEAALLLLSITVQVTLVTPRLKTAGALLVTDCTPQLSVVMGVPSTTPVAVQPSLV